MNSRLDDLLESTVFDPPTDFARQVMQRVDSLAEPCPARNAPGWLPWVSIVCGFVVGTAQLVRFVLCAWIVTNAS